MMEQQANEPVPKSTEQTALSHDYEVLKNGDVKVTQKQTLEFIWSPREFLSVYRQNERALEETRKVMSKEHLEEMKKQEEKILKEMEVLKPVVAESEKLGRAAYEKMIIQGMTQQLKANIAAKEMNQEWWVNVWARAKADKKDQCLRNLSREEKAGYLKIKAKLKRKGIIK